MDYLGKKPLFQRIICLALLAFGVLTAATAMSADYVYFRADDLAVANQVRYATSPDGFCQVRMQKVSASLPTATYKSCGPQPSNENVYLVYYTVHYPSGDMIG